MSLFRVMRLATALLACALMAPAQRYRFRNFGPEDGLNTTISQILQDRTGFLWVATSNGLFRYDGARFQRFGPDEGLPSASVRCLREAPDGTLWVLTGRGLARWRHTRFEPVSTRADAGGGDWHGMEFSAGGQLYLGNDHGLLVASGALSGPPDGSAPKFVHPPGAPAVPVTGIYAERDGSVWFGCGLQLCLLREGRVWRFGEAEGLPPDRWGAILRDRQGDLWVRGVQHLYVWPSGGSGFQARDHGLPQSSNTAMSMIADREGTIWVTSDLGLARLVDGHWEVIGRQQGLESDAVTAVYQDREGSMWIGVWGAGVARWPGVGEWTNWTTSDGLSNNIVWAIGRHPSGALFVGTDHGLVRLGDDGRPPRVWTKADGLAGDKVKAILMAPDGAIWTACLPGGVSRIDPRSGQIRNYGQAEGLSDSRIIGLYLDSENRLWVSAGEGLFRSTGLGPGLRFERQRPPGARERTMFLRFLGDAQGRMWVASSDGLFSWDHGSWMRLTTRDGLKDNGISHVTQTADGTIWVAYRSPLGVSRLEMTARGIRVQHFTRQDGLPSDYTLFLGEDSRHRLWVGTDTGVAVRSSGEWIVYTHEDGMVWDDCAANAFLAEKDGTVWIGTLKGLSRYRARANPQPPPVPPAVITAVRFANQTADPAVFNQVSYRNHDFFASFAGLSFLSERNVRFRYRLVGLDDGWTETGMREIRYPSLSPGSYRFEVSARNGASPWSEAPAVFSFRIVPPWWRTWWFGSASVLLLAAGIGLLVRTRLRKTVREHRRLEAAVRERTEELELQKNLVERQKGEIEELLRQSQEASQLKSEFLANMSHEIRNPMNAVIGMAQLALNTSLDTEQRDYIETVKDSADALLVVINDILDFSKIEAGKLELAQEPFSVRRCVADAVRVFAWKVREKGLRLGTHVSDDVPDSMVGDADRLRQILLNLVGNATKFTERGGIEVGVTLAGSMEIQAGPPYRLRFSVRDSGIGIARNQQALIFEAFVQADGSSKRRQSGTGLGLAICSKLVHLMGGSIEVESTPGCGSEFSFTVPLAVASAAPSPMAALPVAALDSGMGDLLRRRVSPLRILLAEDNRVNQKLAQRVLEQVGYVVTVVEDGRQAIEAVRDEEFDLVLMDVQMPVMDGFEATMSIREMERNDAAAGDLARHIPIIAMTAHAMTGDREQCLRMGMDAYVPKPIVLSVLIDTIERVGSQDKPAQDHRVSAGPHNH